MGGVDPAGGKVRDSLGIWTSLILVPVSIHVDSITCKPQAAVWERGPQNDSRELWMSSIPLRALQKLLIYLICFCKTYNFNFLWSSVILIMPFFQLVSAPFFHTILRRYAVSSSHTLTSFPGLFLGLGGRAGRGKALTSAGHVPILHPEIPGVIN